MIRHLKSGQSAEAKAESGAQVRSTVEAILADIAARGEAAVREYSEKFDKWSPPSFKLSESEIAECVRALPSGVIEDIKFAQTQIRNFALTRRAAGRGGANTSGRCARPQKHSCQQRWMLRAGRALSDGGLRAHERGYREGGRRQAHHRERAALRGQAASCHRCGYAFRRRR